MRTLCQACFGRGVIVKPVAAGRVTVAKDGAAQVGDVVPDAAEERVCKTCRGEGWLEGFRPPV